MIICYRYISHSKVCPMFFFNYLSLFQGDGFDKLVWKVSYYVDWKDNVTKQTGFGETPAFMAGNNIARRFKTFQVLACSLLSDWPD